MNASRILEPEQIRLSSFGNSLRCLSHPSVIASVVLLVLNDHVLKHQYPSVLTGKISDFAGLYFFPFLIALALSLVMERSERIQRATGIFSFLFVAALFTAIKTIPWANSGMEELLSSLSGRSSVIVLDPSDLVALSILLPSWRLWNRMTDSTPAWFAWLVVGFASLASAATSCATPSVITNLHVQDEAIYAAGPQRYSWFVSNDQGLSWQYLSEAPTALSEQLDQEPVLPKSLCDPYEVSRCLRVSGEGYVEESEDGGLSWNIVWEVPLGRREVMDRLSSSLVCGKQIDLGPYDVEFVGSREDRIAIIAMGNEGVLLGDRDGEWFRQSVGVDASPTPFTAQDPADVVRLLQFETLLLIAIGLTTWILLNWLFWEPVLRRLDTLPTGDQGSKWILKPLRRSILVFVVVLIGTMVLEMLTGDFLVAFFLAWPFLVAVLLVPLAGQFGSWRRLTKTVSNSAESGGALRAIALGTFAVFVLGYVPLLLWTLGVVPQYGIAFLVSVSLVAGALILAIGQVRSRASNTVEAMS